MILHLFFNEFSDLIIISNIYNTIFIGDFNFHYASLIFSPSF